MKKIKVFEPKIIKPVFDYPLVGKSGEKAKEDLLKELMEITKRVVEKEQVAHLDVRSVQAFIKQLFYARKANSWEDVFMFIYDVVWDSKQNYETRPNSNTNREWLIFSEIFSAVEKKVDKQWLKWWIKQ